MLTVQELHSLPDLLQHEEEWEALLQAAPNGSFFSSPDWVTSWIEAFWTQRAIRFFLLRREGTLVGLAPFVEDGSGDLGCRRSLSFPVNAQSHLCDVLVREGECGPVARALLSHLDPKRSDFRVRLRHLDTSSDLARMLSETARPLGLSTHEHVRTEWPFALLGSSWSEYLLGRDPHTRSELRRKRRRIEGAGVVQVRCSSSPAQCRAAFEDVLHVESRSWKEDNRTSLLAERGVSEFYQALAQRCAPKGRFRIYVLHLDGTPIAHAFGVEFRQAYLVLKTSYDLGYRELSPGQVLMTHVMEDSLKRGLRVFDFLGEASPWKRRLATHTGTHADLCLFSRRNLACRTCRFAEGRIRPLVRRWLPAAAGRLRAVGRLLTPQTGSDQ
jgi:CelD/BcsL family acetyltransferase involved in cellulose biosynthesis